MGKDAEEVLIGLLGLIVIALGYAAIRWVIENWETVVGIIVIIIAILIVLVFIGVILNAIDVAKARKKEKLDEISKLNAILSNCEEVGSQEQVEELNNQIQKNLYSEPRGSADEYLELVYKSARILNFLRDSLCEEYFNKVKSVCSNLSYQELIDVANRWNSRKDYYGVIFIYTFLLTYHTKTHDIYYKRAMTYYHLKQNSLAIQDIDAAIEDIKLDNALTNQLSQYLIRNGDIYKEDKNYAKAITYYERVPEGSSLHIAAQYSITECQNFISPPKIKKTETKTNSASNKKKAEQTKSSSNTKTTSKKTTDSKPINNTSVQQNKPSKPKTPQKINLESCTLEELATLEGFDEIKAKIFIQARESGKHYYDLDSFVSDYNLQPHEMIQAEERLIFPPRPKNKQGRKIDW